LAKRGVSVTVFDAREPGRGASWAGAGMLAPFSEEIEDDTMLALCAASLAAYPAFVADLYERTGIDAQLRMEGTLHVARDATTLATLRARVAGIRARGGDARMLDRAELLAREPMLANDCIGALAIANEAQVDNRLLGGALVGACDRLGVRIVQDVSDVRLDADARRVRGVQTSRGFTAAGVVVNAAGAWAAQLDGVPAYARVPVKPIAGEMLAIAIPRFLSRALVWTHDVYLVPRSDGRMLVGATVRDRGFDVRVTAGGIAALLDAALAVAPVLGDFAVAETWAGLRPGSHDGRPYLGATALEGYIVATGHYRNGILLTPITARAIADVILTERSPVSLGAFAPGRAPETAAALANA
jgi:glycine oxidase